MNHQLVKKYYPRYKKHLSENTLSTFWNELNCRDLCKHNININIKDKTKTISYLKRHLYDYHNRQKNKNIIRQNNYCFDNLTLNLHRLSLENQPNQEDLLEDDDSFNQYKFMELKQRLIVYNNNLEDELEFMHRYGNHKGLSTYNSLSTYVKVLQSLHDRNLLLHSLVNPLIASFCDKVFINQYEIITEPDIIGLRFNKYGYYEQILIKIMSIQCIDPMIIEEWKLKYGFSSQIIILDFNLVKKKPEMLCTIWSRCDLIEICVNGELNLNGIEYKPYYFNQTEFRELIDGDKDKVGQN